MIRVHRSVWVLVAQALLLSALFCWLTACAGRTPPVAVKVETQRVEVPVAVLCVKAADIPPEPDHVAKELNGQAGHDLLIVDRSALELRTWGGKLLAIVTACAAITPPPADARSPGK